MDKLFRGHIVQSLMTCSPDVFRYLWMSYSDSLLCPLDECRWLRRYQYCPENRPDPEIIGLIIGQGLRW